MLCPVAARPHGTVPVSAAAVGTVERTAQGATLVRAARPQRRTRPSSPLPRGCGGPQSPLRRSAHPATPGQCWALSWVLQVPGQVQQGPFMCTDQDTTV